MDFGSPRTRPRALFVTDLDGTLLGAGRTIHPRCLDAIRRATAEGVCVAIVTGRRLRSLRRDEGLLDGLQYRVGTSNGAVILDPENRRPEAIHEIPWEAFHEASRHEELLGSPLLGVLAPDDSSAQAPTEPDCVVLEPASRRWLASETPWVTNTLRSTDREAAVRKALVHAAFHVDTRENAELQAKALRPGLPGSVSTHVVRSPIGEGALLELVPRGGKGLAVGHLARQLGIPHEATGAVGDEANDADLLDAAFHRYTVGGSFLASARREDATEVASTSEGAVGDALARFLQILG